MRGAQLTGTALGRVGLATWPSPARRGALCPNCFSALRIARTGHRAQNARGSPLRATDQPGSSVVPWERKTGDIMSDFSAISKEELLILLFQMELDVMLQRALHHDAFEEAQDIRRRREQVDLAYQQLQQTKGPGAGGAAPGQSQEIVDITAEGLRLRSRLQKAIADEDYAEAAKLRDAIKELEQQSVSASLRASEWAVEVDPRFRLGQRVWHARKGYRGVVVGWDRRCCEGEEWAAQQEEEGGLKAGANQFFYHVLVDDRDWPNEDVPVVYVAEEGLAAPQGSWAKAFPKDGDFRSAFRYALFLGKDNLGNLIPCEPLRNKYSVERFDVFPEGEEGGKEGDGGDGDGDSE